MTRILGLLSGTSVDGVDAAAASIEVAGDTLRITRLGELTLPWPGDLRERVLAARSGAPVEAGELCRLDHDLGAGLGAVASPKRRTRSRCSAG